MTLNKALTQAFKGLAGDVHRELLTAQTMLRSMLTVELHSERRSYVLTTNRNVYIRFGCEGAPFGCPLTNAKLFASEEEAKARGRTIMDRNGNRAQVQSYAGAIKEVLASIEAQIEFVAEVETTGTAAGQEIVQ